MARSPSVLLHEATVRVEAGETVGAACYIREAVRRALRDLCDAHNCRPTEQTPQQLVKALVRNGVLSDSRASRVLKLDRILSKASRLYHFRPNRMKRAIEAARMLERVEATS